MSTKDNVITGIIVTVIVLAAWGFADFFINGEVADELRRQTALAEYERMNIVCPSLLSIARSSRDTLIVMKNEPLCTTFVLDSLK